MQEGNKKKKWDKPKLIVLVRGDRQEGVLTACKTTTGWMGTGHGPVWRYYDCRDWGVWVNTSCALCSALSES